MGHHDIKALFKKLSQGVISDEELAYLNKWMDSNQEKGLSDLMDKDWSTFDQSEKLEQAPKWMNQSKTKSTTRLTIFQKKQWAIAASILVLLIAGIAYFWLQSKQTPQFVRLTNTEHRKQLIKLSDGSKVWLKRNSSLSYWKPFQNSERVLQLEGEALFEVVTDPNRPFIVHSDYLKTKALGTYFNLISGNNALMPEVALVNGAVEVSYIHNAKNTEPLILKPGEKVIADTINNEIIASLFEEDEPYAWRDDILCFQKADAQEVAFILETWYDIEFNVDPDIQHSGALVHRYDTKKLKIEEVLNGISSVMPYTFQRQTNGSYIIKSK